MADNTEPLDDDDFEIPDSDDVEEEPDEDDEPDFDAPHDHPHTAGYPAHAHMGDHQIAYRADETFAAGGTELFTSERHDHDSKLADEARRENQAAQGLGPLTEEIVNVAQALGWQTEVNPHAGSLGSTTIALTGSTNRDAEVIVRYAAE